MRRSPPQSSLPLHLRRADVNFKVLILGGKQAGKDSLRHRFVHNQYLFADGVERAKPLFETHAFESGGRVIRSQLWIDDTALGSPSFKGISGVIVCADVTNPTSIKQARAILQQAVSACESNVKMVLVATKADQSLHPDLGGRAAFEGLAEEHDAQLAYTDAVSGPGVHDAFERLESAMLEQHDQQAQQALQERQQEVADIIDHPDRPEFGMHLTDKLSQIESNLSKELSNIAKRPSMFRKLSSGNRGLKQIKLDGLRSTLAMIKAFEDVYEQTPSPSFVKLFMQRFLPQAVQSGSGSRIASLLSHIKEPIDEVKAYTVLSKLGYEPGTPVKLEEDDGASPSPRSSGSGSDSE